MVYIYISTFFRMDTSEENEKKHSEFHTYILCCSLFPNSITGNSSISVGSNKFLLHYNTFRRPVLKNIQKV